MNYGNNLIITSDRIPKYGFNFLDKKYFNSIEKISQVKTHMAAHDDRELKSFLVVLLHF